MYKFLNIDKELKTYSKKKNEEIDNDKIIEDNSNILGLVEEIKKSQKKIAMTNMVTQQQIESFQKENENLYKEKIEKLQNEKENLKVTINNLELKEKIFIKKIINIMDEIYRLKYYADNCGNENLMKTIEKNLKCIKKELNDINIEVISSLGEKFDEDFHECIDIKEDQSKENMTIVEEIKVGFIYEGRVIRPAEVVVIKN